MCVQNILEGGNFIPFRQTCVQLGTTKSKICVVFLARVNILTDQKIERDTVPYLLLMTTTIAIIFYYLIDFYFPQLYELFLTAKTFSCND